MLPEFITLTAPDGRIDTALTGRERRQLETEALPQFLPLQRWFGAKDERIGSATLIPLGELAGPTTRWSPATSTQTARAQRYFLPLSARWGEENIQPGAPEAVLHAGQDPPGPRVGALIDGAYDESFAKALLEAMRAESRIESDGGEVHCHGNERLSGDRRTSASRGRSASSRATSRSCSATRSSSSSTAACVQASSRTSRSRAS